MRIDTRLYTTERKTAFIVNLFANTLQKTFFENTISKAY